MDKTEMDRAAKIHQEAIVIDTLGSEPAAWSNQSIERLEAMIKAEMPTWQIDKHFEEMVVRDIISNEAVRAEYARKFRESGLTAISKTISGADRIPTTYEGVIQDLALWTARFDALPEILKKATCANDIEIAKKENKHAVILNFQNTTQLARDIDNIQFFYDFGVRIIQLTYNSQNSVATGCTERTDGGLSNFGLKVVEKLNELGILIDVSHTGVQSVADALEFSKAPIAFTHTFSRVISEHDRGKTDEQLQAMAEKGGYIGIVNVPFFITADPNPTLAHMMDHVDHIVDLVGVDYVGIGTDWAYPNPKQINELMNVEIVKYGFRKEHRVDFHAVIEGFEAQEKWPNITAALVSRGYSDQEIKKLVGGNFLRLFRKVVG